VTVEWILLIYALPSQPSRKRAYVWRELKRLGAIYLRDGVVVLPRNSETEGHLREMVQRIQEFEGTAVLVLAPAFVTLRDEELIARFNDERAAEYRELYRSCVRFLRDVLEEVSEEEFGFPDVDALESELGKLHRWREQVQRRDYFRSGADQRAGEILEKCDRAFDRFVSTASGHGDGDPAEREDAFERLGGKPADSQVEDLPI
jgi:hypothetical protein